MAKRKSLVPDGPGLKILGNDTWYGPGYCGICGAVDSIYPRAVRWWDCDDGWRVGVLCPSCMDEARERGPRPDDYAVRIRQRGDDQADRIDVSAEMGDLDGTYSEVGGES